MSEKSSQNNIENNPAPKSTESALSPEVLEKVMDKVQDIDEKGTAYSNIIALGGPYKNEVFIKKRKLDIIFRDGLLGTGERSVEVDDIVEEIKNKKEKWLEEIKTKKIGPYVYFNIVGRALEKFKNDKPEIAQSEYIHHGSSDAIIFLFDLRSFKEIIPTIGQRDKKPGKAHTFAIDDPTVNQSFAFIREELLRNAEYVKLSETERFEKACKILADKEPKVVNNEGKPKSYTEYGFILSPRVAPRLFRGVVLNIAGETKTDILQNRVNNIFDMMRSVYKNRTQLLIPIYDIHGNLWWPKKMSYEEVKKFVAERDKNKKKND